jgi:hypothetical protein
VPVPAPKPAPVPVLKPQPVPVPAPKPKPVPAPKPKPSAPVSCLASGLLYNACCKGCGLVFSNNSVLEDAVELFSTNPSMATQKYGVMNCWNVSQVTNMTDLFSDLKNFNENIICWDVSQVIDMYSMFKDTGFNNNISNWNVAKVLNMSYMFSNAFSFNQTLNTRNGRNVYECA